MRSIFLLLGVFSFASATTSQEAILDQILSTFIKQIQLPDAPTRCLLYEKIIVHVPWLNAEIDGRVNGWYASLREECEIRSLQNELRNVNNTEPEIPPIVGAIPRYAYIGEAFLYDWDGKVHVRTGDGRRFIFSSTNWRVQDWALPVSPVEALQELARDINPEP
jgi:hypothetical protein